MAPIPLAEVINATLTQLRRGMTLCIITGSTDRTWVRGLSVLRRRGVGALVILLDRSSFIGVDPDDQSRAELAAVRHALAEYGVEHRLVRRGDDIADAHRRPGARPVPELARAPPLPARRLAQPRSCWQSWRSRWRGRSRARSGSSSWTSSPRWRCGRSSSARSSACSAARSSWALPLGAIVGTGVVLWTVGGEYFPALDQAGRLLALRTEFVDWLVVVLGTGYPPQMSPYAIGLGVLMFATAFAAAYAVYRHHRVLDAILLLGAALIVNMSADPHRPLRPPAPLRRRGLAALAARRARDRQDGWQRRRVNETLEVPTAIMRTGIILAGASLGPGLAADVPSPWPHR